MTAVADETQRTVLRGAGDLDWSPPPGREKEQARFGASQILFALSLLLTWGLLYLTVLSGFEQGHAQKSLYGELRTELAEGTAPTAAPIAAGAPVALLSVPDIGVTSTVIVEGTRPAQLQDGPGHVLGTVLPGQQGVSVVSGRSLSFGAPFARLDELRAGSEITVTTGQGVFTYDVVGVRGTGDPGPSVLPAGQSRLTLKTAARGSGGLGGLQADDTVYADAVLTSGAVPAGQKSLVDSGDHPMSASVDATTLALLALALQLLVLSLAGFAWAWVRWSRAAAWIALAPCVLATLWLASSIGSRLLPGLI